ncbi:MAG: zinc-ribbon domain containing protein [Candidatus Zixiibacteriota bacterium]|nr:MAG: zinc-ribbon domain containing protein [candidate division Zixibacteria bacterium]
MDTSGVEPKFLTCVDCGEEFVFTVNAQAYFAEKGYTEDPKRCKHCYMKHKRDKRSIALEPAREQAGTIRAE